MLAVVLGGCVFAYPGESGTLQLSPEQIVSAAHYGESFGSVDSFVSHGLRGLRVHLASAWALDGISKYATFFNDWYFVAYAAVQARESGHAFDISQLSLANSLHCLVEIHARGIIPMSKIGRRYESGQARLILGSGDNLIEADHDKAGRAVVPSALSGGLKVIIYFRFNRDSVPTGKNDMILIDGDGHQHKGAADIGNISVASGEQISMRR